MIRDKKSIILLNKSDLATVVTKNMIQSYIEKPMIEISAKEEKGIAFEEHIIGADGGEIDNVCGYRHDQHRHCGEDEFPKFLNAVISVITRNQHHKH